jgi:DNA repair photolyase
MIRQASLPFLLAFAPVLHSDPELALERRIRRSAQRRDPIAIGSAADPYEPTGRGVARSLLETFLHQEGFEISITTRSPRIVSDLDLLAELDKRHAVKVRMLVPALDPDQAREVETPGPDPAARLRAAQVLASEGITTTVLCAVTPGVNGGEETLRPVVEAAREAGIHDVEIEVHGPKAGRAAVLNSFRRLRLEGGFPQALPGRG